jgi:hypothetical protein
VEEWIKKAKSKGYTLSTGILCRKAFCCAIGSAIPANDLDCSFLADKEVGEYILETDIIAGLTGLPQNYLWGVAEGFDRGLYTGSNAEYEAGYRHGKKLREVYFIGS